MTPTPAIDIRPAQLEELIDLRHSVLRAGLPRQSAYFEGDSESTTRHFAAIEVQSGAVVGCVTILRRDWQNRPAWQLRGMAVEPRLHRGGIGKLLLAAVEQCIRQDGATTQLWCNARTPAAPFYQKYGWQIASEVFVIETAGPHVKMSKSLDSLAR
jgi:predicted GNAT family N-acyltransferase